MNQIQTQDMVEQLPQIKLWNGQRVVTFKDIDEVHQRKVGTARNSFKNNKKHFIKSVDYYLITREDFNGRNSSNGQNLPIENIPPKGITVFTESGYLMIVKSFKDDLSWEVQRRLVNSYFQKQEQSTQGIEQVAEATITLRRKLSWMADMEENFKFLCEAYNFSRKTLYHHILVDVGKVYDIDEAKAVYATEKGYEPWYIMDVVEYFPQLRQEAEKTILAHIEKVEKKKKEKKGLKKS